MADVPVIDLDPYLLGVQATLQILQAAGLIPDLNPLDYIISAFDGKPKLEDTEQAALRLQSSPWWPLRALGNNLQIWVRNGVPLSTGIAADRQELSQWIQGTIDSLEPIVFNRFDPGSLDHAIWLAMTSQFGDQAIRQLNDEIANQHALGPLPTPPGPPPGQPPEPAEVGWHLSRDGDELNDLGDTLIFQNAQLYQLVTFLGSKLGGTDQADCCTKVVGAIGTVTAQLTAIAEAVASAGSSGDLSSAISTITGAINSVAPLFKAIGDCVCALEQNLAGSGVDLSPLTSQLQALVAKIDMFEKCVCDSLAKGQAANDAADAMVKAAIEYWSGLGLGDSQVTQLVLA